MNNGKNNIVNCLIKKVDNHIFELSYKAKYQISGIATYIDREKGEIGSFAHKINFGENYEVEKCMVYFGKVNEFQKSKPGIFGTVLSSNCQGNLIGMIEKNQDYNVCIKASNIDASLGKNMTVGNLKNYQEEYFFTKMHI